jgi:ABC-type lipoprotein release transport system permease subunit
VDSGNHPRSRRISSSVRRSIRALFVARVLRSLLYEVQATDPIAIGAAALVFVGVTLVAWAPSRRAAPVHPLEALRCE